MSDNYFVDKPCIHCTGEQILIVRRAHDNMYEAQVECTFCDARGPLRIGDDFNCVSAAAVSAYGVRAAIPIRKTKTKHKHPFSHRKRS